MSIDQIALPRPRAPARRYDGGAFPSAAGASLCVGTRLRRIQVVLTGVIVVTLLIGLAAAVWVGWERAVTLTDLLLTLTFYTLTALGVTVGLHRLLTHRSFTARRGLRIVLAIAGSMSFQGNVIDWVAIQQTLDIKQPRP
ncbi:hypothetical protein GCM10010191_49790 [Actinomadura vinacea]|uniref:Uncharacterized protein n=1 Tax=Actinomadura vinacea TaxID=115336 RepID=A0ABN3JH39_9ACTN